MKKSLLSLSVLVALGLTACDNGKAKLEADLKAAQTQIIELQKATDLKVAEVEKNAEARIAEVKAFAEHQMLELQKASEAKIETIQKAADEKVAQVTQNAQTKMAELEKSIEGRVLEAKKVSEEKWNEMRQALEQQLATGTSQEKAKVDLADRKSKLTQALKDVKDGIEHSVSEAKTVIAEKMGAFGKAIQNTADDLKTNMKDNPSDESKAVEKLAQ